MARHTGLQYQAAKQAIYTDKNRWKQMTLACPMKPETYNIYTFLCYRTTIFGFPKELPISSLQKKIEENSVKKMLIILNSIFHYKECFV